MPAAASCLRGALVSLLLSSAVAPGPEFSFEKFKDTYVRDGTVPLAPPPAPARQGSQPAAADLPLLLPRARAPSRRPQVQPRA